MLAWRLFNFPKRRGRPHNTPVSYLFSFLPFREFRFVKACRFRCVQARHKKRGTGHADPAVRTNPLLIRSSTATLIGQEGGWEGASFLTALLQVNEVHLLAFGVQDVISHALMRQHRGTAAVRHEC